MLQNNLDLEKLQNMNFVKRKKKRNFHFQIMKNFFGSGLFSMGSSDKGKQKYFIFGPTMFAIPFHEYRISQIFWGFHATR